MVALPPPVRECAGTIDGAIGLPTLQAKPWDAKALLAGRGAVPNWSPTSRRRTCTTW